MASGMGGQEAYQQALDLLADDPGAGCAEWMGDGIGDGSLDAVGDPAWNETLRAVCPGAAEENPRRRRAAGSPSFDASASQSARPAGTGVGPARWSTRGRAAGSALDATGFGGELRKRSARIAAGPFAAQGGHWDGALGLTRIGCVAGNRAYAKERVSSGVGGPLSSAYPGLDGLALTARLGPWRAQTAGAWNRLSDGKAPGNAAVTERRDVGLLAAGLARSPASGPDLRAQAFLARLEAGEAEAAWLAVAGAQWAGKGKAWPGRAAFAFSAASGALPPAAGSPAPAPRYGAFVEAELARRDPQAVPETTAASEWDPRPARGGLRGHWHIAYRQALGAWVNPLQSPRGSLRDTIEGWAAEAPGSGGARAETAFPVFQGGVYAAGLRAAAGAAWAMDPENTTAAGSPPGETVTPALTAGRGEAAWIQGYGPFTLTLGAGFGWRRPGSGEPASDAARAALAWRRGKWQAQAAWARRGGGYAGNRPMPLDLSLGRRTGVGKARVAWNLAWSAADALRPGSSQRFDLSQTWPGGNGIKVEQRLRVPWTAKGIGVELAYQLALEAEF